MHSACSIQNSKFITHNSSSGYRLLLFVFEQTAHGVCAARVDGRGILFEVLDDAFLVHDKRRPISEAVLFVQDAVLLGNGPLKVAQEWEAEAFLFGKRFVGGRAVHADAEDLRAGLLEFGDISLIRLQLLRSAAGERQNVERQDHVLLSVKVAQLDRPTILVGQSEVRRAVSHFQGRGLCHAGHSQGQQSSP